MAEIKTKSGFEFEIPEERLRNNRELFDALVEWLEEPDKAAKLLLFRRKVEPLALGADGLRALYEHCRDAESGVVLSSRVDDEVFEILTTEKILKN